MLQAEMLLSLVVREEVDVTPMKVRLLEKFLAVLSCFVCLKKVLV
jgi:hypothetical protein